MVKISMDTFVKRFQPTRYQAWLEGQDIGGHPEDPNAITAAPLPSHLDVICNKNNGGDTIPYHVVQRMKKQCNLAQRKTFKERNPDLDLEEIQQNPNIPDDVKAVLKESALTIVDADEEEPAVIAEEEEGTINSTSPVDLKTKKDLLDYMDDGTDEDDEEFNKRRSKRKTDADYDDDWLKTKQKRAKAKQIKRQKSQCKEDRSISPASSSSSTSRSRKSATPGKMGRKKNLTTSTTTTTTNTITEEKTNRKKKESTKKSKKDDDGSSNVMGCESGGDGGGGER